MKRKRFRPTVERLEDRCVPSVTASYINGSLYLSGSTKGVLDITGTANVNNPNQFTVTDGGSPVGAGTYTISGNLYATFSFEKGNINLDLMGGDIPGNVLFSLGTGAVAPAASPYEVNIFDSTSNGTIGGLGTGEINGSVTLLKGNGMEFFSIGVQDVANVFTENPFTLDGNLTIAASPGNSSLVGNQLAIGDGTEIFGSVSTTYVSEVGIGSSTTGDALVTISENVSINSAGTLRFLSVVDGGAIMGNLTVTGTTHDDSFALQQVTTPAVQTPGGGFVGGNLNVNLGQALTNGDQILLGPNTEVDGNAYLTAGNDLATAATSSGDLFTIEGSVMQNLTVAMGNTRNSLIFTANSTPGSPVPFVGGNMLVTAGNGVNIIGEVQTGIGLPPATGEFNGTVDGNLTFILGSGNNGSTMDPMIIAALVGGNFNWTSGNGQDFLQLGDSTTSLATAADYNYVVNIHFGNKDDTFILDIGTNGVITGTLDGGGRVTANTFTIDSGNEGTPFTVSNFP